MENLAGGRSVTGFENRYEDRSGAYHWISWNSHPLPEEGLVFAVGRDVTAQRMAEEASRLLSTAVEQAAESVVITDRDGLIQYVNPAFERVTGFCREEVVGQNPRVLKSGRQDEVFYRKMWDTILRGETWTGQLVNRRKDGSFYHERAAISPMRDAAGTISNFVAVKADVSAEIRLQEQLLHAQKMEAIGRLAGGIAHDFNNLLMIIINSAIFIEPALPPEAAERTDLQALTEAANRAAELTRQLLIFSRQQPLSPRRVDLNETVQGLSKMLKRLIGENIELVVTLDPGLPAVKADPMQIEQAVVNLAVNARDAMPQGGRLDIRTSRATFPLADTSSFIEKPEGADGAYAAVTVCDTGAGIPEAIRYRIFEPFFTTKGVGKGTGLGLATTFSSVKQHGGFLSLQTELGGGSAFTLYLPGLESPAGVADLKSAARLRRGAETILLVEDEEMVRRTEARILTSLGYRVIEAANARDALMEADRQFGKIHLMISDIVMPDMSGTALAAEMRRRRPDLPVLLVSGYPVAQLTEDGHLQGGEQFLGKPFTSEDASAALRRLLDGK
jgi:PAS domain S-box-containing protein